MLVLVTFAVTLAAVCEVATAAREIVILDDEPVYRYYDAVKKCADNGHELAWPHILQRKLETDWTFRLCYDCGWTSDRYVGTRPRCSTFDRFEDCARIPDNGVSEVGLIVFCQTADAPTDLANEYNYNVVFSPERLDGSSIGAINVNGAKDVCTDVGARLAYKNQLHRYEGYEHCDCSWVREVRGVYKAGCVPETFTQCPYVHQVEYPVFCFGIPPIKDCEKDQPCDENETCTNTEDGFECACSRSHYSENSDGECVSDLSPCDGTSSAMFNQYNVECHDGNILIQHNPSCDTPNRVHFVKNWDEYVNGFGTKQTGYWAGLEMMHQLTTQHNFHLLIEFDDTDGVLYAAQYDNVKIGPASNNYTLSFGAYSVPAGKTIAEDALSWMHQHQQFSTIDRDNDSAPTYWCSHYNGDGWWFRTCAYGDLNGPCPAEVSQYGLSSHARKYWVKNGQNPNIKNTWMMLKKMA